MTLEAQEHFVRHAPSAAPPTLRPPPIGKPGRKTISSQRAPMGLSRKVKGAIDLMILEGLSRQEAAKRIGLADHSLYLAFRNPQVLAYYRECEQVLRTGERPRSIHKIAELRDKAENERVQLDAAKYLVGSGEEKAGVNVQVNLQQIMPGYQVGIPEAYADSARQLLKLSGSTRNVLENSQSVVQGSVQHDD